VQREDHHRRREQRRPAAAQHVSQVPPHGRARRSGLEDEIAPLLAASEVERLPHEACPGDSRAGRGRARAGRREARWRRGTAATASPASPAARPPPAGVRDRLGADDGAEPRAFLAAVDLDEIHDQPTLDLSRGRPGMDAQAIESRGADLEGLFERGRAGDSPTNPAVRSARLAVAPNGWTKTR